MTTLTRIPYVDIETFNLPARRDNEVIRSFRFKVNDHITRVITHPDLLSGNMDVSNAEFISHQIVPDIDGRSFLSCVTVMLSINK